MIRMTFKLVIQRYKNINDHKLQKPNKITKLMSKDKNKIKYPYLHKLCTFLRSKII